MKAPPFEKKSDAEKKPMDESYNKKPVDDPMSEPAGGDAEPTDGPDPDAMMEGAKDATQAKVESAAGPAPKPENPIQVSAINDVVKRLNQVAAVLIPQMAPLKYTPSGTLPSTQEPLPPDVWLSLWTMGTLIDTLAAQPGGEVLKAYTFDPHAAAVSQMQMRDASGKLNILSRDKKATDFIEKIAMATPENNANKVAQDGSTPPPPPPPPNNAPSGPM
jgi:hypothetical protein